jgi:hypothetical protein
MKPAPKGKARRAGSRVDRLLFYTVGALGVALLAGMVWSRPGREGPDSIASELSLLGLDAKALGPTPAPTLPSAPAPEETTRAEPTPAEQQAFSIEVALAGSPRRFRLMRLAAPPAEVQHFPLANPERIVLDVAQASSAPAQPESFQQIQVKNAELRGWLRSVRIGSKGPKTRMVLDLAAPASYEFSREPGKVLLTLGSPPS